jgi:hypothetical protein
MGLFSIFSAHPSPLGGHIDVSDDRLAALGDVNVLDGHLLLAATSVSPGRARKTLPNRRGLCQISRILTKRFSTKNRGVLRDR